MRVLPALLLAAACGSTDTPEAMPDAAVAPTEIACSELAATWSDGVATCSGDCTRWDVSQCTRADTASWETVEPATRDAKYATARCNDGTPFDFDVRLAATPTTTWVIHLSGGAFCDDLAHSCAARQPQLKTTSPRTDRQLSPSAAQAGGIVSRDPGVNPTFATANHVRATYCSSDFWSGATTERRPTLGDPANGWYFSGHANVAAMFAVLAERYGLDDASAQVLFSGSSAGAFGVHFNAAAATAALPETAARGELRLFIDAGWLIDWVDPDPAPPDHYFANADVPDAEVWKRARALWGATFDPACEAVEAEPSRCLFGEVWYPHVAARTPVLVQQSSIDAVFTGEHGIDPAVASAARSAWQAQVEASLAGVGWLFSLDQPYHTLALSDAGMNRGPAGRTPAALLARFWADGTPERVE